jgi:TPP-dependent 2-oxoacid decarboxylase
MAEKTMQDPMEAIQKMWGSMGFSLPGMVTPTLDVNELDKRISDLKSVEGWLKMNLGVLQMTIQGLEMQRATLSAMAAFGQSAESGEAAANPFTNPAAWPWNYMAGATPATSAEAPAAAAKDPGTGQKPT